MNDQELRIRCAELAMSVTYGTVQEYLNAVLAIYDFIKTGKVI